RVTEIEAYTTTTGQAPGAFGKVSPVNGTAQTIPGALTLRWQQSSGATSYEYCYDTIDDGVCSGSWVSTTAASATILPPGGLTPVFWQVRARNAVGVTEADSGTWWRFTTAGGTPTNVAAAANGATATASSFYNSGYTANAAIDGDRRGVGAGGTAWT